LIGIEIYQPAAQKALEYYDRVFVGDIETLNLTYQSYFDYVICGDILEHLIDPWLVVQKIHIWLKTQGLVITSIPNIRYWQFLIDLIFKGKWEYQAEGLLDQTHLRFFTRKAACQLFTENSFQIMHQKMLVKGRKKTLFNKFTFQIFEEFVGEQIIIIAQKMGID